MKHLLPDLPYSKYALEPYMSAETLDFHHGKHHQGYVDKLNELIDGTVFESLTLEEIIKNSSGPVFNNASQHWNHSFFWNCLTSEDDKPSDLLFSRLERDFDSFKSFKKKFVQMGTEFFGAGYLWLIEENGKLKLEAKPNAENPIQQRKKAILTCDLWEHAYYIDYRNERPKYLEACLQRIHWTFAEQNLNFAHHAAA